MMRRALSFSCLLACLLLPALVAAQVPDPDQSSAWTRQSAPLVGVLVIPDGSGDPLSAAQIPGGGSDDATIYVRLKDANGDPVTNYPAEDIWLETASGGLVPCTAAVADGPTDVNGETQFARAFGGGGHSEGEDLFVVVDRERIAGSPPLAVQFHSPDIDGDGDVDAADEAILIGDFGSAAFRSDLDWSGAVDSADAALLDAYLGVDCDYAGAVAIDVAPDEADAPWLLLGPSGYELAGNGDQLVEPLTPGLYTLHWQAGSGWHPTCDSPETHSVADDLTTTFACAYEQTASLDVQFNPAGPTSPVSWTLDGPEGYHQEMTDGALLGDLVPGEYELAILAWSAGWYLSGPDQIDLTLAAGEAAVQVIPFVAAGEVYVWGEVEDMWRLTGPGTPIVYSGNYMLSNAEPGEYTVDFPWWDPDLIPPPVQTKTLAPGSYIDFDAHWTLGGRLRIEPRPAEPDLPWHAVGPAGWDTTGVGDLDIRPKQAGTYTVTWLPDFPWTPSLPEATGNLVAGGTLLLTQDFVPGPRLLAVEDVPNDQGRSVRLRWWRCLHDDPAAETPVTGYAVYRRIDARAKATAAADRRDRLGDWDYLSTVPARTDSLYSCLAPTLCDSTDVGVCLSVFMVSALTAEPWTFFDSPPDSGYSVDDLSPAPPPSLAVDFGAGGNALAWEESPDTDVGVYRIYRLPDDGVCDPQGAAPVQETAGLSWTDPDGGRNVCYAVAAVDFAGNEGPPTAWDGATITDVSPPACTRLCRAAPNPFNPRTTLDFELAAAARVRLSVHDLAGRRIRFLVDEDLPRGRHRAVWSGRDDQGRPAPAGVYLVRFVAGDVRQTQRVVMVK